MQTVIAISVFHWHPCPACRPLLPSVPNGFFNAVHYPGGSVVIAAFPGAFRETHEAFPLFQDAAGFPIGQDRFLFRRQLHRPSFPCANAILLICGEPVISSLRQTSLYPAFLTDSELLIRSSIFFRVPAPSSSDLPQQSTSRA